MKIAFVFLALTATAFAADSAPRLSRLYEVDVPSATAAEFFDVQRDTAEIYQKNKGPHPRFAWTSLTGENKFYYLVPMTGLDKMMDRTWLSEQGDEPSRQARTSRLRNTGAKTTIKIISGEDESTWDPTPDGAPDPFIQALVFTVKPGKVADFQKLLKQYSDSIRKAGKATSCYVSRLTYGGDGYEFNVIVGYASLADIPTGNLIKATMGDQDYATFVQKMGEAISGQTRNILRYRPEYSYIPAK